MKRTNWLAQLTKAGMLAGLGGATMLLTHCSNVRADEQQQAPQARVVVAPPHNGVEQGGGGFVFTVAGDDSIELGKYWIGVSVREVSETLSDQLELQNGLGVVALDVVDQGPAQKGGILKHDILLTAGEAPLRSAKNLVAAVNKAESKELTIELVRKGHRKSVTVKPAGRRAQQEVVARAIVGGAAMPQHIKGPNGEDIQILVQPGKPHMFWQPGVPLAVPPAIPPHLTVAPRAPLPNGVSISMSRTNNDPAKVSVKRGSESWEVTDRELDKLPADLRPHVEGMLNPHGAIHFRLPQQPVLSNPQTFKAPMLPKSNHDEAAKKADVDKLRQQLDELSRKLDQLNQQSK